jgi:hypothetical protein
VGALWSFVAALIFVLSLYMPAGCAAAAAGLALVLTGGILCFLGIRHFKTVPKQLKEEGRG